MASFAIAPADIPQSEWEKGKEAMRRTLRGFFNSDPATWGQQATEDHAKFCAKLAYRPDAEDELQTLIECVVVLARKAHYYWLGGLVIQARGASLRRARRTTEAA